MQTPGSKVIVLGTRFSIEASKDRTEVAVIEGTVRLEAKEGERTFVEVTTGEVARVNERGVTSKEMQVVYWDGKKRVHVRGCRRLTTDPQELAKLQKMTLAEARAKGLPLCSKCPGSTTPGLSPKAKRARMKRKRDAQKKQAP